MINSNVVSRKTIKQPTDEAILILGKADTEYKNLEILKANSISSVEYMYGKDSELTAAYKESILIGASNVFLCNCFKFTDYISIIENICKENFAYIVPLFNFSETFALNENTTMYLCEFYSNMLSENITQIFVSDMHASLYENLDHFVRSTNNIISDFNINAKNKLFSGDNLCFILNVLKEYRYANVALASILQQTDLKKYPQMNIGDVVFDLNNYDFYGQEVSYFAYDINAKTSIENFLNFKKDNSPEKFVPVNIIKQRIQKSLDLSEFTGRLFSPYMRIALENKIESIMRSHVGNLIESYRLIDIRISKHIDRTVSLNISISFKPYNSIEDIAIEMEM